MLKNMHAMLTLAIICYSSLAKADALHAPSRPSRLAGDGWVPGTTGTRRLLQVAASPSDTLTVQINAPAPLSTISSPCCCVTNATAANGQTCCCGIDKGCCALPGAIPLTSPTNFCSRYSCTGLWVGSLVAVATFFFICLAISCRLRRRGGQAGDVAGGGVWAIGLFSSRPGRYTGLRRFAGRAVPVPPKKQPMKPLPTSQPPAEDEGKPRECPVCLEEKSDNSEWRVFPCKHATCSACYKTLFEGPPELCLCPLCRLALMVPLEDEETGYKWGNVSTDGSVPFMNQRPASDGDNDTSTVPQTPIYIVRLASAASPHASTPTSPIVGPLVNVALQPNPLAGSSEGQQLGAPN